MICIAIYCQQKFNSFEKDLARDLTSLNILMFLCAIRHTYAIPNKYPTLPHASFPHQSLRLLARVRGSSVYAKHPEARAEWLIPLEFELLPSSTLNVVSEEYHDLDLQKEASGRDILGIYNLQ